MTFVVKYSFLILSRDSGGNLTRRDTRCGANTKHQQILPLPSFRKAISNSQQIGSSLLSNVQIYACAAVLWHLQQLYRRFERCLLCLQLRLYIKLLHMSCSGTMHGHILQSEATFNRFINNSTPPTRFEPLPSQVLFGTYSTFPNFQIMSLSGELFFAGICGTSSSISLT